MEWLHVRVVRGSQKALAKKNSIKSLQDHTEPLKEELIIISKLCYYYYYSSKGSIPIACHTQH